MFYCPTPQNSQDFQSKNPKIFNFEVVFPFYSSVVTSSTASGTVAGKPAKEPSAPLLDLHRDSNMGITVLFLFLYLK